MLEKIINDIHARIVEFNSKNSHDAIPHSDAFFKTTRAMFGLSDEDLTTIINILKDSHKVLIMEIVKEDPDHDVVRIEGYVDANLKTIRRLKNYFQVILEEEYEKQTSTKMSVHQIIKEFYNKMQLYKNTTLGQIANKTIMLIEFEKLLEKEYLNYSDNWTGKKLHELIDQHEHMEITKNFKSKKKDTIRTPENIPANRRATDYSNNLDSTNTQSLKKMLSIYGVEFFFRLNLRKYNFSIIIQAIENNEITRRADLKTLKTMLQKIKDNFTQDPELINHSEEIHKLERMISKSLSGGFY